MSLPLCWIDAFSDRVFGGNPAAVVPLDAWPEDAVMQQIAFENGLAETAFFVRTGDTRHHLRWWCELAGERVRMAGHTVLYLRGEIAG